MIKGYYDVIKCKLNIPTIQSKLQMKEVDPSIQEQYIIPDEGYDGLASVKVNAIDESVEKDLIPSNIRAGKTIFNVEGNMEPDKPDQNKTAVPSTEQQIIRADNGYELAQVTIEGVDHTIDENIIAENIREGTNILGVMGTYDPQPNLQNKLIEITQNGTTIIEPDTGYDGLSDVDVTVSGILDTSDATAIAKNITNGATAYVNGQKLMGTLPVLTYPINPLNPQDWDYQFQEATSNTLKRVTRNGVNYILGTHTVVDNVTEEWSFQGNSKMKMGFAESKIATAVSLTPTKLRKGYTILGVTGTYEGTKIVLPDGVRFGGSIATDFSFLENMNLNSLTSFTNFFNNCTRITSSPNLSHANYITSTQGMFNGCANLKTVNSINTSRVTAMGSMFSFCSSLEDVPILNASLCSGAYSLSAMFQGCTALTNESLNNILAMCISATNFTGAKTLATLGLTSTQATTCQSLSNWNDFVNAGWSTGY